MVAHNDARNGRRAYRCCEDARCTKTSGSPFALLAAIALIAFSFWLTEARLAFAEMAEITFHLNAPNRFLDLHGQRAGFVLLAAFLVTFLFIRTSARMNRSDRFPWWPGSVTTGSGLHLHHLVWGIVLLMLTGFIEFATRPISPWNEILAGFFGVGVGLTLDEFALWIYLRDVYWTEEGRSSFDAVVVATVIGALILVGVAPFDVSDSGTFVGALSLVLVVDVLLGGIAIYKGKLMLGLVGIFVPLVSLVGAIRLAAPGSRWARRRYTRNAAKAQRATERWERIAVRRRRITDLVAGAPHSSVED